MAAKRFYSLFMAQYNISCDIYHYVFPHIKNFYVEFNHIEYFALFSGFSK